MCKHTENNNKNQTGKEALQLKWKQNEGRGRENGRGKNLIAKKTKKKLKRSQAW